MPAVLNTNVASLWASKNLSLAQSKMADSVERLSSGLRINRARDDAAGLGISNQLQVQINGANQGIRNLGDGISMLQTAEGAISASTDMALRIATLATQASTAGLSLADRTSIQDEMVKLMSSINQTAARTKFSGNALLSGTKDSNTTLYTVYSGSDTTNDKIELKESAFANIGAGGTTNVYAALSTLVLDKTTGIQLSGTSAFTFTAQTVYTKNADDTYTARTIRVAVAAGNATATTGAGDNIFQIANKDAPNATTAGDWDTVTQATLRTGFLQRTQTSVTAGQAGALSDAITAAATNFAASDFTGINNAANAYVTALNKQRSSLGAYQNQLENTISNVTELSSNIQAARSRIIDTDYASETASLTKGQILQQAATAMLAQANQMPNVILSLLK